MTPEYRICQFCRGTSVVYQDGTYSLFKYGVRHYAHAPCLLTAKGEAAFDLLPEHVLRAFPALVADKHGLLDVLIRKAKIDVSPHR